MKIACKEAPKAWICALLVACSSSSELPPKGQLVLYLDTDAPLPSGDGRPRPVLDPVPLFDRVRIEGVRGDGAPCNCTTEFDVTREMFVARAASFGVVGPLAGAGTVRVRLFRGSATVNGNPDPGSTLDTTFNLPRAPADGIVERTLVLHTDDVGNPVGLGQPVDTLPGRPSASRVGTWPAALRHDCSAPPNDDEVCVPGGAYWMGNLATAALGSERGDQTRLVVLSPFFVDATELTVGTYRRLMGIPPVASSGQRACSDTDYCTWTAAPGPNEAYPVNCLAWSAARSACTSQGKDLPTEAQFEYLAGGLEGREFVWGQDAPQCPDAVLERGGRGNYSEYPAGCLPASTDTSCQGFPAGGLGLGGPEVPGSGLLDRLPIVLPGWQGTVVDLAGNLHEWVRDAWNKETDPCWSQPGVYTDPLCASTTSADPNSIRGGDWTGSESTALAARRLSSPKESYSAQLGFRCVRASP